MANPTLNAIGKQSRAAVAPGYEPLSPVVKRATDAGRKAGIGGGRSPQTPPEGGTFPLLFLNSIEGRRW